MGSDAVDITKLIRVEPGTVPDSDTLHQNVKNRVWAALKRKYDYAGVMDESEEFMLKNVSKRFRAAILYVDLVGSTQLGLDLPPSNLISIVGSFVQEMGNVVVAHRGMVLKFMGDATLGYFVNTTGRAQWAVEHAVSCAKSMIEVTQRSINAVLSQYDYSDLHIRIGIDYGLNLVVRYGKRRGGGEHLDIMGRPMNMAAKIQSMAKPNQILIGGDVYRYLHPQTQKDFRKVVWEDKVWRYRAVDTGNIYDVYEYVPTGEPE